MRRTTSFLILILFSVLIFPKDMIKVGAYSGYFSPRDEVLKGIYGKGDIVYGLKVGVRIWRGLYGWLSGMQYKSTGETSVTDEITTLTLNPIHISVRYTFELSKVNPYLELGYNYMIFKEKSRFGTQFGTQSESEFGTTKDNGGGFCFDAGVEFKLSSKIILDVGMKYSRVKVLDIDLGGFQAGLGFLVII